MDSRSATSNETGAVRPQGPRQGGTDPNADPVVGMSASASQRLARFARELTYESVPSEVLDAAKLHFLDAIGCGLAAHGVGTGVHARTSVLDEGGGDEATLIGSERHAGAAGAALANGTLCHALDFDDTHAGAISHVSTVVCPAALAVAEAANASGRELLAAVVAGNEVVIRIGRAAEPAYMVTGFHPTSVCGVFGATVAAGRLLGLDEEAVVNALGVAGSMAAGLFEYLADGSSTKPIHAGWAAHAGVLAARLAAHGASGPVSVFEGRFGVFHAYHRLDGAALFEQIGDLGRHWETPRIAYKPYPACHFVHSPLEAVRLATGGSQLDAESIERIVVSVPEPGIPLVCEPRAAKIAPRSEYDAKFSVQYSVAAMLVHGEVGVATYSEEAIVDPRVLALAGRVQHEARSFPSYPASFPGAVRIELSDGRTLEAEVAHERGGASNPMSDAELLAKFRGNASLALAPEGCDDLEAKVLALEELEGVRGVLPLGASA